MTEEGQALSKATQGMSWDQAGPMWRNLSSNFAQGAQNVAHAFQSVNGIGIESIWARTEYPILKENGVNIIYHIVN